MMFTKKSLWLHLALIGCALAVPVNALAADSDTPEPVTTTPAPASAVQLKRVTVNARRPQSQPPATLASVIDDQTLEQERLYRFEDLSQLVTGLDIDAVDAMDTTVTIRGIGDGGESGTNIGMPGSVGVFLDGVYLSRPGAVSNDLLDIDNIQDLKGAQGLASTLPAVPSIFAPANPPLNRNMRWSSQWDSAAICSRD